MIKRIDTQGMHAIYDRWPHIAREAYERQSEPPVSYNEDIDHIVFAGMGGSGAIGDLFAAVLSKTDMHVTVTKGYEIPNTTGSSTLVIATSVSGNTPETITALNAAATRTKAHTMAVSAGGRIAELCHSRGIRHVRTDTHHSPRASFVCVVFSMLGILEEILPLRSGDVKEAIVRLEQMHAEISSENINSPDNVAQNIAERIGTVPLIYYPFGLQAAAIRFKNDLQENAKMHAIVEDVLESCHNGIVAWEKPSEYASPVLITGSDDHPKTKQRWQILKEYFASKKITYEEMHSGSGGILAKLVGLIYWADYASIYRAIINGTDPTPIEPIEFVKSRL